MQLADFGFQTSKSSQQTVNHRIGFTRASSFLFTTAFLMKLQDFGNLWKLIRKCMVFVLLVLHNFLSELLFPSSSPGGYVAEILASLATGLVRY